MVVNVAGGAGRMHRGRAKVKKMNAGDIDVGPIMNEPFHNRHQSLSEQPRRGSSLRWPKRLRSGFQLAAGPHPSPPPPGGREIPWP